MKKHMIGKSMDICGSSLDNPEISMDYLWMIHRYVFSKKNQTHKNNENEKDARRKMIAIRLINSSSTSVSNSNTKKHMIVKSVDITTFFLFSFLGGRGVCDVTSPKPPSPAQVTHVRSLNKKRSPWGGEGKGGMPKNSMSRFEAPPVVFGFQQLAAISLK